MATAQLRATAVIEATDKTKAAFRSSAENLKRLQNQVDRANAAMSAMNRLAAASRIPISGLLRAAGPVAAAVGARASGRAAFRNFSELESSVVQAGLTANATEAQMSSLSETLLREAPRLGVAANDAAKAINSYAAAGLDFATSGQAVMPTLRTAKAAFGEVNDVATSGIAVMQNLAVPVDQLAAAFDRMLQSSKEGQVEMKDLSRELPAALASYSKVGRSGLAGLEDVTTQMQLMRKSTSSASEAANRLQNLYEKITSEETVKGFKELGINLPKALADGVKRGESNLETVVRLMMKATRKADGTFDPFKVNSVFGDMQARAAIENLMKYESEWKSMRGRLARGSTGAVQKDLDRVMQTAKAQVEQYEAEWNRASTRIGSYLAKAVLPAIQAGNKMLDNIDEGKPALTGVVGQSARPYSEVEARLVEQNAAEAAQWRLDAEAKRRCEAVNKAFPGGINELRGLPSVSRGFHTGRFADMDKQAADAEFAAFQLRDAREGYRHTRIELERVEAARGQISNLMLHNSRTMPTLPRGASAMFGFGAGGKFDASAFYNGDVEEHAQPKPFSGPLPTMRAPAGSSSFADAVGSAPQKIEEMRAAMTGVATKAQDVVAQIESIGPAGYRAATAAGAGAAEFRSVWFSAIADVNAALSTIRGPSIGRPGAGFNTGSSSGGTD